MTIDLMFWLATAAFAWGLSLASYRWFATYNDWPMGEWQAHRPGLPIAIGLLAVLFAMLFALARGDETVLVLPLSGLGCAIAWTALTKVAAQAALILAPLAMLALLTLWMALAVNLPLSDQQSSLAQPAPAAPPGPAATDRDARVSNRDRGINGGQSKGAADVAPPAQR